jgi:hypothetical protein
MDDSDVIKTIDDIKNHHFKENLWKPGINMYQDKLTPILVDHNIHTLIKSTMILCDEINNLKRENKELSMILELIDSKIDRRIDSKLDTLMESIFILILIVWWFFF